MNQTEVDRGRELLTQSSILVRRDPEEALRLAEEALVIAREQGYEGLMAGALHNRGYALTVITRYDDALAALQEALEIAGRIGHEQGIMMVTGRIAAAHVLKGDYPKALEIYHDLLERTNDPKWTSERCYAYNAMSAVYSEMGEIDRAVDMVHAGLVLSRDLNDAVLTMQLLQNAGSFHIYLGEIEKGEKLLTEALELSVELADPHIEAATVVNLSVIMIRRGDWEKAREYSERAYELYSRLGSRSGQISSLVQMAETAAGGGRIEDARELFARGIALASPTEDRVTIIGMHASRGEMNLAAGALDDALFDFEQSLRIAREIGMRREEMHAEEGIARVHELNGDTARALEHYKNFSRLREEILNEEKQKATAEFQARFDAVHAEHQREIYRLRAEELESDVRRREQELATMALELVHENELIGTLRNRLARIRTQAPQELRSEIDSILRDLDASNMNTVHWKRFEQQLDLQQRGFIARLTELYPVLRPMELKVAALLRLGLATKDIALLLSTSVRNIESHRYWIRKALNLPKEQNLSTFLAALTPSREQV